MRPRWITAILILSLVVATRSSRAEEEDLSAAGYDNMRIEQEEKLFVPLDVADDVLAFLKQRYLADKAGVAQLDPLFTTYLHIEDFTDVYFDTPSLQLIAMQSGVRHRSRVNLSDPGHRKSGVELMQIKINDISSNDLERGEIKFAIEHQRPVTPEDSHPMLGIVKREHRDGFKKRLGELGLDPGSMRKIVTVHDRRTRIYFERERKPFLSISFDQTRSKLLWAEYHFVEIEPELNEIAFTDADPGTRRYMESILAEIVGEIQAAFPQVQSNLTPKYNKSFFGLEAQIPFLRTLVRANLHRWPPLAGLALVGLAVIGLGGAVVARGVATAARQRSRGLAPHTVQAGAKEFHPPLPEGSSPPTK